MWINQSTAFWIHNPGENVQNTNMHNNPTTNVGKDTFWNIYSLVEEWKTNLMSLVIVFHFLCAQNVSDINISIIRSLRLFCWITTLVVLFLVRYVLEFRCGWVGLVSVLQAEAACNTDTNPTQPHRNSNTHRTKNNTTNVVIRQNSRTLLMMDILMFETY